MSPTIRTVCLSSAVAVAVFITLAFQEFDKSPIAYVLPEFHGFETITAAPSTPDGVFR